MLAVQANSFLNQMFVFLEKSILVIKYEILCTDDTPNARIKGLQYVYQLLFCEQLNLLHLSIYFYFNNESK